MSRESGTARKITIILAISTALGVLALVGGCGEEKSQSPPSEGSGSAATSVNARPQKSTASNTQPPAAPVNLVFVHHSVGEDWLNDTKGGLAKALVANNYYVSDVSYGWGPADRDTGEERIGDHTDIGHWYNWFSGPNNALYLKALFQEKGNSASYERASQGPAGENEIIMFKSCFTNSPLGGSPQDPPAADANPLRGQGSGSEYHTVGNAKGIYMDLLDFFRTRQDKLFIVITAPPNVEGEATPQQAANARALNRWLVDEWLNEYPYGNVAVFDFYDVLTTDGNFSAYGSDGDSHPNAAGLQKATSEFTDLLNIAYNRWQGD